MKILIIKYFQKIIYLIFYNCNNIIEIIKNVKGGFVMKSIFEELTIEELEEVVGSGMSKEQCKYIWSMCLLYPQGCTDPCNVWRQNCT